MRVLFSPLSNDKYNSFDAGKFISKINNGFQEDTYADPSSLIIPKA